MIPQMSFPVVEPRASFKAPRLWLARAEHWLIGQPHPHQPPFAPQAFASGLGTLRSSKLQERGQALTNNDNDPVNMDGNHLAPDTLTGLMEAPVYRNSLFHLPDPRNRPQTTGPAPPLVLRDTSCRRL